MSNCIVSEVQRGGANEVLYIPEQSVTKKRSLHQDRQFENLHTNGVHTVSHLLNSYESKGHSESGRLHTANFSLR